MSLDYSLKIWYRRQRKRVGRVSSRNKEPSLNPINLPYADPGTKVTLATDLTHLQGLRYTY